jgi:hypothetical protein
LSSTMRWSRGVATPCLPGCGCIWLPVWLTARAAKDQILFDKLSALEQWVEQGKAPNQIIASHNTNGKIDRTRPLCPYPQVARYQGTGSPDEAANFICKSPQPGEK